MSGVVLGVIGGQFINAAQIADGPDSASLHSFFRISQDVAEHLPVEA